MPRTWKRVSKSGLTFPVARLQRYLREGNYANRINVSAAICLAGALEYLTAEILELAGDLSKRKKKFIISPRHIMLVIRNDAEFDKLLKDVHIPESGYLMRHFQIFRKKIIGSEEEPEQEIEVDPEFEIKEKN